MFPSKYRLFRVWFRGKVGFGLLQDQTELFIVSAELYASENAGLNNRLEVVRSIRKFKTGAAHWPRSENILLTRGFGESLNFPLYIPYSIEWITMKFFDHEVLRRPYNSNEFNCFVK